MEKEKIWRPWIKLDNYGIFTTHQMLLKKHLASSDILKIRPNSDIDYLKDLIQITRELKLRNNELTEKLSVLSEELKAF